MNDESYLLPPDREVWNQILADHTDAYQKQGTLLKWSGITNIVLIVGTVASLSIAAWSLTKERDHFYALSIDPRTSFRTVIKVAGSTSTDAGRLAAADRWIRDAYRITSDQAFNARIRSDIIAKLDASPVDKDRYWNNAQAELEANKGFIHTVENIDFTPPSGGSRNGLSWDAIITLKIQDMRENVNVRVPTTVKRYIFRLDMKEVPPTAENIDGLVFAPNVPKELKDVEK